MRRCKLIPLHNSQRNCLIVKGAILLTSRCSIPDGTPLSAQGEVYMLPFSPYEKLPSSKLAALPTSRVVRFPTHPNHSFTIAHLHDQHGRPWQHCPRQLLCAAIQQLRAHNLSMQAGFEMEFVLLRGDPSEPHTLKPFGSATGYALLSLIDQAAPILDHMVSALQQANIKVTMMHAEGAPGHFEIVLHHNQVLAAVDDLVLAREIVRSVALQHHSYATFIPKYGNAAGSGSHVHFSLDAHFGLSNKLYDHHVGMSSTAQQFVAGVLEALPWLTFLTNASVASYARLQPQCWVGVYKVWGISNKEAPLRLSLDRSNIELKTLDALSNVYIAMTGVIAAGLNGIRACLQLPPPCQTDPHLLAEGERAERLPTSLAESLERFRDVAASGALAELFAPDVVRDILAAKSDEIREVDRIGMDAFVQQIVALH